MNLNTLLWILQAILGIKFLSTAFIHAFQHYKPTMQQAIQKMGQPARPVLSLTALVVFLASIGLLLPAVVKSLSWLVPLSAAVLAVMNLISIPIHLKVREKPMLFAGIILLAMSAFVAYGRWIIAPL